MSGKRLISWLGGIMKHGPSAHDWQPALRSISEHNGAVELMLDNGADDDSMDPMIRTRLLRFDGKGMIVERPDDPAARRMLRAGVRVKLLTLDGDHRWEVITRVVGVGETRLNKTLSVQTMALGPPIKVRSAQRREHYRVSMGAASMAPVELEPLGLPETDRGVPVDGVSNDPFEATLVNLGGGGMGVRVASTRADRGQYFKGFMASMRLGVPDGDLKIQVRVVRREVSYDDSLYLGLRFEYDHESAKRYCEDVICHFTSEVQCQQLHRERGAG